jgi:hypothetical protein
MWNKRIRQLILLGVLIFTVSVLVDKLWCQFGKVTVVVVSEVPTPEELRRAFQRPPVPLPSTIESSVPYEQAVDKRIEANDLRSITRVLAWGSVQTFHPRIIEVHSPSNVIVVVRDEADGSLLLHFTKATGNWHVEKQTIYVGDKISPTFTDRVRDFIRLVFLRA